MNESWKEEMRKDEERMSEAEKRLDSSEDWVEVDIGIYTSRKYHQHIIDINTYIIMVIDKRKVNSEYTYMTNSLDFDNIEEALRFIENEYK